MKSVLCFFFLGVIGMFLFYLLEAKGCPLIQVKIEVAIVFEDHIKFMQGRIKIGCDRDIRRLIPEHAD